MLRSFMTLNWAGLAAALATFIGIWWGHVAVREVEAKLGDIRPAMALCIVSGLGLWLAAALTDVAPLAAALGILGMTLLWDAYEFYRQEKRIKIGHAPANPDNPRHARFLAEYPTATTLDLLDRDPVGRPVGPDEAAKLVGGH